MFGRAPGAGRIAAAIAVGMAMTVAAGAAGCGGSGGAATADEAIAGLLAAARAGDVGQASGLFPSAAVLASALSCPPGSELAGRYGDDAVQATLKAELAGLAGLGLARRAPERDASETVAVGAELGGCRATAPLRLEKVGVVLRDGGGREAPEVLRFAVIGERWYLLRL